MFTRLSTFAAALLMSAWPVLAQDAATSETPAEDGAAAGETPAAEALGADPALADAETSDSVPGEVASLIAEIKAAEGASYGTVTAAPTPSGLMLVTVTLSGAPSGIHGVHLHETGTCTPPDFESAGGHIAGDHDHGVMTETGSHPGDMPNIYIPEAGELTVEYFVPGITTEMLTDDDGAAFVVHAQPDDYSGQPSGNSGDRVACGNFSATE